MAKQQTKETAPEAIASTCSVLAVGLFALTFIFENFLIPSSSMASTLLTGDHVLVERESLAPAAKWAPFLHYGEIQRGDVIVFYKPALERNGEYPHLVKRVVGIPGDHLHLRNGLLYRNGVPQVEPYAAKTTAMTYTPYVDDFPVMSPATEPTVTPEWAQQLPTVIQNGDVVVPAGSYFVMGDNRDRSYDSRFFGFVPRENIVGRPLFVYWSIEMPESGMEEEPLGDRAQNTLHEVVHFFDETRWSRTFHRIQ
jgi:signal peptidase I